MPKPRQRVFRVHREGPTRFVSRNETPQDSPLGVDRTEGQAIGAAVREATLVARDEGCRVVIEVQGPDGKWRRDQIIEPPAKR